MYQVVLSLLVCLFICLQSTLSYGQEFDPTAKESNVEFGNPEPLYILKNDGETVLYNVEIADNFNSRARGLMFRESMDENAGMLFEYETARIVNIHMKNTMIPLDILYIRPDGVIAKMFTGAVPFSLQRLASDVPVLGVLELNAGQAETQGLMPGDKVLHGLFGTQLDARSIANLDKTGNLIDDDSATDAP